MTEQLERQLRELVDAAESDALQAQRLAAAAVRVVRRQRLTRRLWAGGAATVFAAATVLAGAGLTSERPSDVAARTTPDAPSATVRTGSARDEARCPSAASARVLRRAAFAFDGTVTSLGPTGGSRRGHAPRQGGTAAFAVHEWFRGGPDPATSMRLARPYPVGSRLLVAAPSAPSCGGLVRRYDTVAARAWRTVFGRPTG